MAEPPFRIVNLCRNLDRLMTVEARISGLLPRGDPAPV